jgi:hypothetical protein
MDAGEDEHLAGDVPNIACEELAHSKFRSISSRQWRIPV